MGSFRNQIAFLAAGTRVELTVLRDGKRQKITVTIEQMPTEETTAQVKAQAREELGMVVENLTEELADRLGYQGASGVVVTQVEAGSPAALAGIQPGALVQEVDRKTIHNVEEFDRAVKERNDKGNVLLRIRDGRYSGYIVLKLD